MLTAFLIIGVVALSIYTIYLRNQLSIEKRYSKTSVEEGNTLRQESQKLRTHLAAERLEAQQAPKFPFTATQLAVLMVNKGDSTEVKPTVADIAIAQKYINTLTVEELNITKARYYYKEQKAL